jgi:hypothetical protein
LIMNNYFGSVPSSFFYFSWQIWNGLQQGARVNNFSNRPKMSNVLEMLKTAFVFFVKKPVIKSLVVLLIKKKHTYNQ